MIFKIRIAHWRFTFTLAPVTNVIGVNSNLQDGDHIIMWDFDDVELSLVTATLKLTQKQYYLPNIYILNTGTQDHYIAYCLRRVSWQRSVFFVAATNFVDPNFFKYGVYREHWTLRVTKKEGRKPQLAKILYSSLPEDVSINELNSWVKDTGRESEGYAFPLSLSVSRRKPLSRTKTHRLDVSAHNMKHSLTLHP
jgi:hypothetical protein